MDTENGNPGRRIEVVFSEIDRKVAVDLADDHPDEAAEQVTDGLVRALWIDDPDEAERELASGAGTHARVRRLA